MQAKDTEVSSGTGCSPLRQKAMIRVTPRVNQLSEGSLRFRFSSRLEDLSSWNFDVDLHSECKTYSPHCCGTCRVVGIFDPQYDSNLALRYQRCYQYHESHQSGHCHHPGDAPSRSGWKTICRDHWYLSHRRNSPLATDGPEEIPESIHHFLSL